MKMLEGIIYKALSGFYYVKSEDGDITCRARGRFRNEKITPLVGDRVLIAKAEDGSGTIDEILPRKNEFVRPSVSNLDQLIIIASAVNPVTDPFLIDRVAAIACHKNCDVVICINKCDVDNGDRLFDIYSRAGFITIRTSPVTRQGIDELYLQLEGKISAFTGNSGVGKSSILNSLGTNLAIKTGEVSEKLGRGRHTTRHVELFPLKNGAFVADTPGFSAFDPGGAEVIPKVELQYAFREFSPFLGGCRFLDCAHIKDAGCAVTEAVSKGMIHESRHSSYTRMHVQAASINDWEKRE